MGVYGSDLLEEKNLWQIYKECIIKLPASPFNMIATISVFIFLLLDCLFFPEQWGARVRLIRSLCDAGLGFGSTILGFLIAGFTIFATLAKPEMLKRMYDTPHKKSGLSYLKVNFFAFVEVFVVYIFLLVAYLFIKIFGAESGFLVSIISASSKNPFDGYVLDKAWIGNTTLILLGTASFYGFLALKSFIFNTYHAVMTSAVWSFNAPKQDASKSQQSQ